jgi:MoxR-like ATPase
MSDSTPRAHSSETPSSDTPSSETQASIETLRNQIGRVVVGQTNLVDGLLIALFAGGHALVEGVPGLAKTTAVRTLAQALGLGFGRIQFTPDLLPADLVGTPIFVPDTRSFVVRKGPIFAPVLLADEINRAPAKVQSALLEAMEERQVTIGDQTFALPDPFFVMATQNPIELEGTYPLPEAQIDRFLVKLVVPYPAEADEREIVARDAMPAVETVAALKPDTVASIRVAASKVHAAPSLTDYAVRLARATRNPAAAGVSIHGPDGPAPDTCVALGASPRGSMYLIRAARVRALIEGRDYATPQDIKRVAPDVLRHRIVLTYEAEADGIRPDAVVDAILAAVETP